MADIVLINPRFEVSFWGLEHVLPYLGKRANMPPGSLPLLAALTPAPHRVTRVSCGRHVNSWLQCTAGSLFDTRDLKEAKSLLEQLSA